VLTQRHLPHYGWAGEAWVKGRRHEQAIIQRGHPAELTDRPMSVVAVPSGGGRRAPLAFVLPVLFVLT